MLDAVGGFIFLILLWAVSSGIRALFSLLGWTGEAALLASIACALLLLFCASLIYDGTIKIGRKRRDDE